MKKTLTQDTLHEILDYALIDPEDIVYGWESGVTGYSGRGMYGRSCFALSTDELSKVLAFFQAIGSLLAETAARGTALPEGASNLADLANNVWTDSLGRGTVYYFPGWVLEKADDDA